jgi:hypothetical protein
MKRKNKRKGEVEGRIDKGEIIPTIVEQIKEDEEVVLVDNYVGDSDEEGTIYLWNGGNLDSASVVYLRQKKRSENTDRMRWYMGQNIQNWGQGRRPLSSPPYR